jgi:hypothetical protein
MFLNTSTITKLITTVALCITLPNAQCAFKYVSLPTRPRCLPSKCIQSAIMLMIGLSTSPINNASAFIVLFALLLVNPARQLLIDQPLLIDQLSPEKVVRVNPNCQRAVDRLVLKERVKLYKPLVHCSDLDGRQGSGAYACTYRAVTESLYAAFDLIKPCVGPVCGTSFVC